MKKVRMSVGRQPRILKIQEILPSKSKDIIDEIDDLLAEYYGLDKTESDFIKSFDIEFRTSKPELNQ
jgi:hypothetical protein